jgi:hypothetical protein
MRKLIATAVLCHAALSVEGEPLRAASPDGLRVVSVHLTEVIVADTRDLSTKAVARLTWEDSVKAVLRVGWHGNDAVWIEGHVNPSTNIYYEWNVATGERVRDLPGSRFSWSPDGKHLAYTEHRAHFSPDAHRAAGNHDRRSTPLDAGEGRADRLAADVVGGLGLARIRHHR